MAAVGNVLFGSSQFNERSSIVEAWATGLSWNGRGATRKRRRTGDTSSSMRKKSEVGRSWSEELARLIVAIERLSDGLERHGDILHEGRCESPVRGKESKSSLRQSPTGKKVPHVRLWRRNVTTTL